MVAPDPSRLSRLLGTLFEESWLPVLFLHALIFARWWGPSLQESVHLRRTEDTWPHGPRARVQGFSLSKCRVFATRRSVKGDRPFSAPDLIGSLMKYRQLK